MDPWALADALVERVRRRFPHSVDIVAAYGSQVRGDARPDSDLDLFFIPATPDGAAACLQFVFDGIGCDFWPIAWERAERIAGFHEPIVSVVADATVLYARDDAVRARFDALQSRARSFAAGSDPPARRERMDAAWDAACAALGRMHLTDVLADVRHAGVDALARVLDLLALRHGIWYATGWAGNLRQAAALPDAPSGLLPCADALLFCTDVDAIRRACVRLVAEMDAPTERSPVAPPTLDGAFEESWAVLTKIAAACDRGDAATACFTAWNLERVWVGTGAPAAGFGDGRDLPALKARAGAWAGELRLFLETRGIPIREFADLDAVREAP